MVSKLRSGPRTERCELCLVPVLAPAVLGAHTHGISPELGMGTKLDTRGRPCGCGQQSLALESGLFHPHGLLQHQYASHASSGAATAPCGALHYTLVAEKQMQPCASVNVHDCVSVNTDIPYNVQHNQKWAEETPRTYACSSHVPQSSRRSPYTHVGETLQKSSFLLGTSNA